MYTENKTFTVMSNCNVFVLCCCCCYLFFFLFVGIHSIRRVFGVCLNKPKTASTNTLWIDIQFIFLAWLNIYVNILHINTAYLHFIRWSNQLWKCHYVTIASVLYHLLFLDRPLFYFVFVFHFLLFYFSSFIDGLSFELMMKKEKKMPCAFLFLLRMEESFKNAWSCVLKKSTGANGQWRSDYEKCTQINSLLT